MYRSEQSLVDCSNNNVYYNGGCNGGLAVHCWSYVITHGLATNAAYPYTGVVSTQSYFLKRALKIL